MRDLATELRCMIGESVKVKEYPKAGGKVSGLSVDSKVSNMTSISSSLTDYTVLRGIRRVPMKDFDHTDPKKLFYAKDDMDRVRDLAAKIKQNKRITPLIVVVDDEGIYVLEGGHRLGALHLVGVKELPALIVHDDEALGTNEAITRYQAIVYSHLDIVRQHKGWAQKAKDREERQSHLDAAQLHQKAADAYDKLQDDNKGIRAAKKLRLAALKATRALKEEVLSEAFQKMTLATFDPELFIGQWFLSKKPADPKLYKMLAKKYPFKGRAWRLDESPYDKPYASWCGTLDGISAWKQTQDPSGLGRTPTNFHVYSGQISKGIDLTKLVKGEKLTGDYAGKRIMAVAEVIPVEKVKNVTQVYGT